MKAKHRLLFGFAIFTATIAAVMEAMFSCTGCDKGGV
jgi:hypothetical protein